MCLRWETVPRRHVEGGRVGHEEEATLPKQRAYPCEHEILKVRRVSRRASMPSHLRGGGCTGDAQTLGEQRTLLLVHFAQPSVV